tara:strand:+ start:190 stop:552 length:363 start_codon:yes stop_codon:yes gene_type:complete
MKSNIEKVYSKLPKTELAKVELTKVELALIDDIKSSSNEILKFASNLFSEREEYELTLKNINSLSKKYRKSFNDAMKLEERVVKAAKELGVKTADIPNYRSFNANMNALFTELEFADKIK